MTIFTDTHAGEWCLLFGLTVHLSRPGKSYLEGYNSVSVSFLCWSLCFTWETK